MAPDSTGAEADTSSSTGLADSGSGSTSILGSSSGSLDSSSSTGNEPIVHECGDGVIELGDLCFEDGIVLEAAYGVPSGGFRTLNGHFDADAHLDLALIDGQNVRWLLGDGTGSFTVDPRTLAAADVHTFDVGDFDGDGLDDLVLRGTTPNNGTPSFRVVLNRGDEGWEVTDQTHLDGFARAVGAFDYDGDGNVDVVTASEDPVRSVRFYYGDGLGMVGAPTHQVLLGEAALPRELELFDISNDGQPDVSMTGVFSSWGYVYRNAQGIPTAAFYPLMLWEPGLALVDLDADGDTDALVTHAGALDVFLNDGDGTFTLANSLPESDEVNGVAAADFDQDGFIDAAVTDETSVRLYRGTGVDFTELGSAQLGDEFSRHRLRLADFNEDSVPDVVVDNHEQAVLLLSNP